MAGIDPRTDPRGARWEQRMRRPVLAAAWLAIPTVLLYFSKTSDTVAAIALGVSWAIWLVFVGEAVIMLSVVADRRAWIRGHLFSLAIVLATFPLLTHILEGLLAARALSSLQGVRVLQVLYLAKAAKLLKSLQIVRHRGELRHPVVATLLVLVLAAAVVGIIDYIVSGKKHTTPFHGTWDLITSLPGWTIAVVVAAIAGIVLAAATGRRPSRGHS